MEIDSKFPYPWRRYLIKSSYVVTVFFITLTLTNNLVIIASIGATASIVFVMPNDITAKPKRIIGGHFLDFFIVSCFAVFPFMNVVFSISWYNHFVYGCFRP